MRSSMLLAALAAFSASVSAVPAKKDDCTCVNVVTSTTVVFDRTKVVKTHVKSNTTLDPKTKQEHTATTTTIPVTESTTSTVNGGTSTNVFVTTEPAGLFKIHSCVCPTTSVSTKTKTVHGTVSTTKTITDKVKHTPKPVTTVKTNTKSRKSTTTQLTVSTQYYTVNTTSTAPYPMTNGTQTIAPTGPSGSGTVPIITGL